MLRIKLLRIGRKKRPFYRLVVAENTAPPQGKFVEIVGNFNPFSKELNVKKERIEYWITHGAKPTKRVASLLATLEKPKGEVETSNKRSKSN